MFCEVSPELAAERGLKNGGWATIRTRRAEIEARVLGHAKACARCACAARTLPPDRIALPLVEQGIWCEEMPRTN